MHYLDGIGNGFYRGITEKLKPLLVAGEYRSYKIINEIKNFSTIPVLKDMVIALQSRETEETKQFNLGAGDGNTKVFNYVGPVLKESGNMTIFVDGMFINLATSPIDEANVVSTVGKTDDIVVQELKPEYVYEKMVDYYQLAKSFEYLNFNIKEDGVSTKLRNISVDFKVNESGNLDLWLNNKMIEDPKLINFNQMLVLENNYVKNSSITVFNNMNKIYNVEFMKLLMNESKNAAAIIINVNEDYYVYDFIDATKREKHIMNGFKLQQFVAEKFGYDVRALFNIQMNDVKDKITAIDERKREIQIAIDKLVESNGVLTATMNNPNIKPSDKETLKTLLEKVETELVNLKNSYILLEDEQSSILGQSQPQPTAADVKLGDTVSFMNPETQKEDTGRVVATPKTAGDTCMVSDTSGRIQKVDKVTPAQPQKTNESQVQDIKPQDTQAQDTQAQDTQAQDTQAQDTQAQDTAAQDNAQTLQTVQQGIMGEAPQTAPEHNLQSVQPNTQVQDNTQETDKPDAGISKLSSVLGELKSAISTARPEVREQFTDLEQDLDTLIKQTGELERLKKALDEIKGVSEKADLGKATSKFEKIFRELEKVITELQSEFGKGAQQVVISESLISSSYEKYLAIVTAVVTKLTAKVSNMVKKLSGDIIDLDADVKVISARAYATKAKEELGVQNTDKSIPTSGQSAQDAQTAQAKEGAQDEDEKSQAAQEKAQKEEEQSQKDEEEAQKKAQEEEEKAQKVNENFDDLAKNTAAQDVSSDTRARLSSMDDAALAEDYASVFNCDPDDLDMENREQYINELVEVYNRTTGTDNVPQP